MPALSKSFNLGLSSVLASVALATAAVPAHAQDAPPPTPEAAATETVETPRPARGTTTTLDRDTCMETTTSNKRDNFLIFGSSRSSSTSTYNEECGRNQQQMTRGESIATMMGAVNADGSPNVTIRTMGLQLYRQLDDNTRQHVDAMLEANNLNEERVVLSITPSGGAAVCVRQAAPPATTAPTSVRVSFSFRCAPPASSAPAPAADATATTADTAVTAPAPEAAAPVVAPVVTASAAAPRP